MCRSAAMSLSRPMGINSDVLNTKTAKVNPTRGNHRAIVFSLGMIYII